MSGEGIGGAISGVLALYFFFDFFFWNGGLLDPSIMARFANVGMLIPS